MALKDILKNDEQKLEGKVKRHKFFFFWDPVILYFIAIIFISNYPTTPTPELALLGFAISDKIKHVILYFGFSILLGVACRHSKFNILRQNHFFIAIINNILSGIKNGDTQTQLKTTQNISSN